MTTKWTFLSISIQQLTEFMLMTLTHTRRCVFFVCICARCMFKTERDRDKYRQNSFIDWQWITINGFFLVCGFFETVFFCTRGSLIFGIDFRCSVWILRFVSCCSRKKKLTTQTNERFHVAVCFSQMRNAETS